MEGSAVSPADYDDRRGCFVPLVGAEGSRKCFTFILEAPECGLQSGLHLHISLANMPTAWFGLDPPKSDRSFLNDSCGLLRPHRKKADALHGKAPACCHLPGLF